MRALFLILSFLLTFQAESRVGKSSLSAGPKWKDGGLVILNSTDVSPVKGTVRSDKWIYGCNGKNEVSAKFLYDQTSGGSGGSGDYVVRVHSAIQFDLSLMAATTAPVAAVGDWWIDANSIGSCEVTINGIAAPRLGRAVLYDSTGFRCFNQRNADSGVWGVGGGYHLGEGGGNVEFEAVIENVPTTSCK